SRWQQKNRARPSSRGKRLSRPAPALMRSRRAFARDSGSTGAPAPLASGSERLQPLRSALRERDGELLGVGSVRGVVHGDREPLDFARLVLLLRRAAFA